MEEAVQSEPLAPEAFVEQVTSSANLVPELSSMQAMRIAMDVIDDYEVDKRSMKKWFDAMKKGIELATLEKSAKTYPFPRAANIKFPLVTEAALQFNARAYPAIVQTEEVVKVRPFGEDPAGLKAARGQRVAAHMSWQLSSDIEEWESETDKLLVQLPYVGTMVRKTWRDTERRKTRSRVVKPGRFIVNDNVQNLEDAPRMTEEIPLYPIEIKSRMKTGTFIEFEWAEDAEDRQKPEDFIEQHCLLDLDEDGMEEPYIATVHVETRKLVRLVADFDPEDVVYRTERQMVPQVTMTPSGPMQMMQAVEVPVEIQYIRRGTYFTDYHFLPSLDGGFWGTGFGLLLGDLSSSINSLINMMMDAGHYASLGGGFIGSEFRIKGGHQNMKPGEWRMSNVRGADIRQAIVDLKYPGADATLYQLLGLLIEAAKGLSSTKDILTGDTGSKNMTATTTLALIEQGLMVFTAVYKRIYRSLKKEFRVIAKINAVHVTPEEYNAFHDGQEMFDPRADYDLSDMDILPMADPRSVTKMQEAAKAELLMQTADRGLTDPMAVGQRVLEAASIPDVEELAIKPDPMAEPMKMLQLKAAEAEVAKQMADIELVLARVQQAKSAAAKNFAEAKAAGDEIVLDSERVQIEGFEATIKMLEMQRDALAETLRGGSGNVASQPRDTGTPFVMPLSLRGAETGGN